MEMLPHNCAIRPFVQGAICVIAAFVLIYRGLPSFAVDFPVRKSRVLSVGLQAECITAAIIVDSDLILISPGKAFGESVVEGEDHSRDYRCTKRLRATGGREIGAATRPLGIREVLRRSRGRQCRRPASTEGPGPRISLALV
jgi:hypothetical protein